MKTPKKVKKSSQTYIKAYAHLRKAYGRTGAEFIQLVNRYLLNGCGKEHDGRLWVYNTQKKWGDLLGVSHSAAYRLMKRLREKGVIETAALSDEPYNTTLYVCLNLPIVDGVPQSQCFSHIGVSSNDENGSNGRIGVLDIFDQQKRLCQEPQEITIVHVEMAEKAEWAFRGEDDERNAYSSMSVTPIPLEDTQIPLKKRAQPRAERRASNSEREENQSKDLALCAAGRTPSLDVNFQADEDPIVCDFIHRFRQVHGEGTYQAWLANVRIVIAPDIPRAWLRVERTTANNFYVDCFMTRYSGFIVNFCNENNLSY